MSQKRDYYEVLGVKRKATKDEIKGAFRRLAMRHHPDRNQDKKEAEKKEAESKFKEMREAYSVLTDDAKREQYDRFGHTQGGPGPGPPPGGFSFRTGFGSDNFSDIFEDIFGEGIFGGARRSRQTKGHDRELSIDLTLEEVAEGVIRHIRLRTVETCDKCKGSGRSIHTETRLCTTCKGSGRHAVNRGAFILQRTCPACGGEGHITRSPCDGCNGEGVTSKKQELAVTIPPGVDTGDLIRLAGRGDAGLRGGPHGDLYIRVNRIPHPIFTRKGDDLHCEIPVSFPKAALGTTIEIPTLKGTARIEIPPETQNSDTVTVDGAGIKGHRSRTPGDLKCRILVETPVNLSPRQVELMEKLDASLEGDVDRHSPKSSRSILEKIKDFVGFA